MSWLGRGDPREIREETAPALAESAPPPLEPPPFVADSALPLGLSLEQVVAVDERRVFLRGWIWDAEEAAEELTLISPSGGQLSILDSLTRVERPDVAETFRPRWGNRALGRHGFFGTFEVPEPAAKHSGYQLELRPHLQEPLRVGSRRPITDPLSGREVILNCLTDLESADPEVLREQVASALRPLQKRSRDLDLVSRVLDFGPSAEQKPETSLIIPLFGRLDLIEHQLVRWADDPARERCELLYVLDSPALEPAFEELAFQLSNLYRVALRCVVLSRHAGYAGAVNRGAAAARGHHLVLMHSDVLPDRPGWTDALAERLGSAPAVGAVGAKLVYEDGSLQHAGVELSRHRHHDGSWTPVHRFKGLPGGFPAAGEASRVRALSGACLMIPRDLWERLGGFRDVYLTGAPEGVDLCLRCGEAGYESWYEPAAELFHLEGQSRGPESGDPRLDLYDRGLLTRLWDRVLRQTVK